jgi:hypothetical protein
MSTETSAARATAEDRLEIDDLLARYNWAVDTDDGAAFASTFTANGEFVTAHKLYKGTADILELMRYLHEKRDRSQRSLFHFVSNVVLEPLEAGDDGSPRLRFVAQLIGPRIDDDGVHTLQLGWYDDVLERTAAGWRFARRHFRPWPDTAPTSSPVPFAGTVTG